MATSLTEKGRAFRELHDSGIFVIPNPWSAGTAQILEKMGFKALATTSAGLAFSLGLRDGMAAVNADVTLRHAREIVEATSLPVSADLENGFGDSPDSVYEVIQRAGEVGLVGASIEDAKFDGGAPLYDFTLAVERIEAAVRAAKSLPHPFTLTARTEGFLRGEPDMDETLRRLTAFESAGADVLYAPGLPDLESVRMVCGAIKKPFNFVVGFGTQQYTLDQLCEAGVRRVSTGSSLARAALGGFLSAAKEVSENGTFSYTENQVTVTEMNRFFRTDNRAACD